jgi:hypothetical protein
MLSESLKRRPFTPSPRVKLRTVEWLQQVEDKKPRLIDRFTVLRERLCSNDGLKNKPGADQAR